MRRRVGVGFTFACAITASSAAAQQPKPAPTGAPRSSTQFTLRREEAGGAAAASARARARSGDCAAALADFDAAITNTIEPTLRRDRGVCHDRLGHRFPAIEDYRAYLTALPEAPDADQIRQRLAALEEQAGVGGPSAASVKDDNPEVGSGDSKSIRALGSGGSRPAQKATASADASSSDAMGPKEGEPGHSYEYYAEQERLTDAAEQSPLRYGKGIVLGAVLHMPRFWVGELANDDLAYGVGGTLRYSTGRVLSLVSEIGYSGIGTSGETSAQAGPLLFGGVEARIGISRYVSDALLLRGGVGFEHLIVSGTRAINRNLLARFAFGYRHVFGPSLGLELLADGGPALVLPDGGDSRVNAVIGGSAAFTVGF